MNGSINGYHEGSKQPAPTPVPIEKQNGDTSSPPNKMVRWTATEKDLLEIQKTSAAIGLGARSHSSTSSKPSMNGEVSGMKFISLAAPLSSHDGYQYTGYRAQSHMGGESHNKTSSAALQSLPMRATIHKQKQIPGRFFPSPSYTEFQRDVLESRPTPRRIIRKFKPSSNGANNTLFPAGSPVKANLAAEKSSLSLLNNTFPRVGQDRTGGAIVIPTLGSSSTYPSGPVRQYSIPASTTFHDGNNDTLITGLSIALRNKNSEGELEATSGFNKTTNLPSMR